MHIRPRELFDLIAVALVCCTALLGCSEPPEDPLAFATDVVRLAPLIDSVLATGTIHTVTSIEVSSQLSGRVDEVAVDFNDKVIAGQPLATLDRQRFESKVTELRAGLAVARAEVAAADAAVEGAIAELEDAERDFSRKEALFAKGNISVSVVDEARTRQRSSASVLLSARAQARTREAGIAVSQAGLRQAEIDLERTVIRAPIDGIVIKRSIQPGQTVAASLEAPELFIIAHDLKLVEVHASVDEADIGKIRGGQRVSFRVDAHPGRSFDGQVSQIRKAPEIVQNVVTYTVVISAANTEELMLPGMTAVVEIISAENSAVLRVPNAALRFVMPAGSAARTAADEPIPAPQSARVWVIEEDGRAAQRSLELGYSNGEFTAVSGGNLQAGESVIIGYRH